MLKKQFNKKDFTTVDYKRIHVQQPKGVDLNTLMQRVKEDKKKEKKIISFSSERQFPL